MSINLLIYGHKILNEIQKNNIHVPLFFTGLLEINLELMNMLSNSPGNKIFNPVFRLVASVRKPMIGGPTKNPINAVKERNAM